MTHYNIQALDKDGYQLSGGSQDWTRRAAIETARGYLSDRELLRAGLHTVRILNDHNQCVWDRFVEKEG